MAHAITLWACTASIDATDSSPRRYGSSPRVSCARPHDGWRSRFTQMPPQRLPPWALISFPTASPTLLCSSRSHEAPRAMATGKRGRVVQHDAARAVGEADRRYGQPRVRPGGDRVVVVLPLLDGDQLDEVPPGAVARHLQDFLPQRHLRQQLSGVAVHLFGRKGLPLQDVGELEDACPRFAHEGTRDGPLGMGPPEQEGDESDDEDEQQPEGLHDLLEDAHGGSFRVDRRFRPRQAAEADAGGF